MEQSHLKFENIHYIKNQREEKIAIVVEENW